MSPESVDLNSGGNEPAFEVPPDGFCGVAFRAIDLLFDQALVEKLLAARPVVVTQCLTKKYYGERV
jgi:hypothetical protein